jgi:5'-nucleotidase
MKILKHRSLKPGIKINFFLFIFLFIFLFSGHLFYAGSGLFSGFIPCPGFRAEADTVPGPAFVDNSSQKLIIAHTNDTHSHIEPFKLWKNPKSLGGIARRSTLLKLLRKKYPDFLYIDSGDLVQGTLFFNFFKGDIEFKTAAMSGLDIMCIGNHEFDEGQIHLLENIKKSPFPVVCSNLVFKNGSAPGLKETIKKALIKKYGDFTILFTGIVTPELLSTTKEENLRGISVADPVESIKNVIKQNSADFVVILSHQGFFNDLALASECEGINLIIGGHSHTKISTGIQVEPHGTWIFQTGQWGRFLGLIMLEMSRKNNKAFMKVTQSGLINIDETLCPDPEMEKYIQYMSREFSQRVKEKIGSCTVILDGERGEIRTRETNLGSLTADIIRDFCKTEIAFQNAGAIRASIRGPEVKVEDVLTCFPFSDEVVTLKLTGIELEKVFKIVSTAPRDGHYGGYLQISGMKVVYSEKGVEEITVNNKPLDAQKTYTIATNAFLTQGGDGLTVLRNNPHLFRTGVLVSDLVIEYFRKNSPVHAQTDGRISYW